jgi:hypothetical protein
VTSARQDHTSDTSDGCHNKENGSALRVKPRATRANYRQLFRTTGGLPAEILEELVTTGSHIGGARSRKLKGPQGHQVQRPIRYRTDATHEGARPFISLRDRSINLPTYERRIDINTTAQTAIRRFRCCAYDDLPQRPLAPSGQHPYQNGGELDQSARLATKQRIRGRRSPRRSTIAGGSTAGRQDCRA